MELQCLVSCQIILFFFSVFGFKTYAGLSLRQEAMEPDPLKIKTKQNVKILTGELKTISNQTSTYKLAFTGKKKEQFNVNTRADKVVTLVTERP